MDDVERKSNEKFNDLSWLMPAVDLESALERLGSTVESASAVEIRATCPDHHIFTGVRPSGADWSVNRETGKTFCFTEGRGSNIVWTVVRALKTTPENAVEFLTGGKGIPGEEDIAILIVKNKLSKIRGKKNDPDSDESVSAPSWLNWIRQGIENGVCSDRVYRFFMNPPGKPPTNIVSSTVDHYDVREQTWGKYCDRAIVPIKKQGEIGGFVAIDLWGQSDWCRRNPLEKKYRKSLYPYGMQVSDYVFGIDDCRKNAPFMVLTEGAREVMKLWQEGFVTSGGLLGTNLSETQIRNIARLAPEKIVLMFDGDKAGRNATDKIGKLLEPLFPIIPVYLPEGVDPKQLDRDEMVKVLISSGISAIECDG